MKTKFTILSLFTIVAFIFQSCSTPKNVIKLQPQNEPSKWLYGQAFVSDSIYGINYEVGFDRLENNQYLFDFHITNRSNMPILIDPVSFYCQPLDGMMNPLVEGNVYAIDPESEIMEIDKQLSVTEARKKNQLGITLAAVGVGVAAAIITHTDDNPNNDFIGDEIIDDVRISNIENNFQAINLNELRDSWTSSTIRKTTLETNYAMFGKVFFPAFPQASYLRIFLPVDDDLIEFTFSQVQFPAN